MVTETVGGSAAARRRRRGGDPRGLEDRLDAAPFVALRYDPAVVGDLAGATAPAYDAVGPIALAAHRTANPYTVLELLAHADGYRSAAAAYRRWLRTGVLRLDPGAAYYRYDIHWLRAGVPVVQRGLVAAVDVAGLLPHEHVEVARVADRMRRIAAVPVDVAPVYALVHGAPDAYGALLARGPADPPVVAVTDEDGVDHRIWRLDHGGDVAAVQAALAGAQAVIADGHHRWAAARAGGGRVLTYLVDADHAGPDEGGVHRVLPSLPADALERLSSTCTVDRVDAAPDAALHRLEGPGLVAALEAATTAVVRPRPRALETAMPAGHSAAWRMLDTAIAEHLVLPALGLATDAVRYTSRADEAVAAVRLGEAGGALLVRGVPASTVFRLAAAGELLPPKSTSFTPKPRTGLLLRPVEELDASAPGLPGPPA